MPNAVDLEMRDNGVVVVTMNSAVPMNVFNADLCYDMISTARELRNNDDIRCVIIRGEGPCYSAGGDLHLLSGLESAEGAKMAFEIATETVRSFYDLKVPVISAVHGAVAGAAVSLMLASDIIVAAEKTAILFSFVHVAFCADSGCSYFLPRKVGYHKAAEMLILGQNISADQALQLGIVNRVVPLEELTDTADKLANRIAAGPPGTITMNKALLRASATNDFYAQSDLENYYQVINWMTDDFREGAQAFFEKRKPIFKGTTNTMNRKLEEIGRSR